MNNQPKNDGGPAFPSVGEGFNNAMYSAPGMSLRDWFAGMVLQGLISGNRMFTDDYLGGSDTAYKLADAMLTERVKGTK